MNRIEPPGAEEALPWVRAVGERPIIIFKHSPSCGTSFRALRAFEQYVAGPGAATPADYLVIDVLDERPLSQAIAKATGVRHESPQVLVLKNGMCVWTTSHISINVVTLADKVNKFLAAPKSA